MPESLITAMDNKQLSQKQLCYKSYQMLHNAPKSGNLWPKSNFTTLNLRNLQILL